MFRWYVIRTLTYKEILRYRYNWGLLVVVAALLALSGLVSISARFNRLPGQGGAAVTVCHVYHRPGALSRKWVERLKQEPPPMGGLRFHETTQELPPRPLVIEGEIVMELLTPNGAAEAAEPLPKEGWNVRYWYGNEVAPGVLGYRDWVERVSNDFLGTAPRLEVTAAQGRVQAGAEALERLPIIVASLAIFALYLLSFNLFITSTGEEREKRILLGILLSPAAPQEVLAAKALFYATFSVAVASTIVGTFNPILLLQPMFWLTVICGSVTYVAIGTVVISIVRRQTTINTLSTLYLIATSIIMLLSQFLAPFVILKILLIENYLYAQMKQLVADQYRPWMLANQCVLVAGTVIWCIVATWTFSRQATSIGRAR